MKFQVKSSLLLLILLINVKISGQNAVIKEDARSILTYPFSDPNPVPSMGVSSMISPFYPYFVFDGYTDKGKNREWKVISLDNDYINVTVLPEMGGKVWGAIEKSTGQEFVYQNHVMKFRAIGIRGPWTSGGIEHNFGLDLGHAPWTASPVDYVIKQNDDGSVSCIVGGLDLASRTQWRVNIKLPKDKAYFETESMWYNPTPLHDAYLSWENGGFRASDDLQFFFPGYYYIGHDGSVSPWPFDEEGRDLSWYKNNNFGTSKSYHVSGYFTDWFGGYWHDADFGFGHSAPYSDVPGKKIWIWSLARDGAIWTDLLTDRDGQYIEAQSGVKFNQANRESGYNSPFTQLSMRPYYTDTKTEYWFPVIKTKGISDASEYGALNVASSGDSLNIYISPNSEINDSLVINIDRKPFLSTFINLKPMQVFHREIYLENAIKKDISVRVGKDLMSFSSDWTDKVSARPSEAPESLDYNSAEHLFRIAEDMNAMRNYKQALEKYLECLQKEPTHTRALYRIAELYYKRAEYSEALTYAKKILENDTYDGSANFIIGVIMRSLGKLNQSEEAFSVAARTMEYRSAAYLQIAGLKMLRKDLQGAVEYSKKTLDFNHNNLAAYEILISGYRKLNNVTESEKYLNELLEIDPLNHYAGFENYLLTPSSENLNGFKASIRNELPYETFLELAIEYADLGLNDEAIKVLEESPSYPVVFYWLAYLYRDISNEKSYTFLSRAEEISPYLVFPHRLETIPVLAWAENKTQSWKSKYYLALVYWHILQIDKAAELFEKCGDIPDYAPFYIARGSFFSNFQSEYCHPCNDFSTAVKIDPAEWRTWHYLINFLQSGGAFEKEKENAELAFARFPGNPVIGTDYAKALLNSGMYMECLKILEKVKILPQEGAHEGHDIFELANLSLAVGLAEKGRYTEALKYIGNSEKWPENLGAGKPYDPDIRFQHYISAFCHERLGKQELANQDFEKIINLAGSKTGQDQDPVNLFITLDVLNEKGEKELAAKMISQWKTEQDSLYNWSISSGSSSSRAKWLTARYMGDTVTALKLEQEFEADPSENRFRLFLRMYNNVKRKIK